MRLLVITQVLDDHHPILGFMTRWVSALAAHADQVTAVCLQRGSDVTVPDGVRVFSLGKEERRSRLQYLVRLFTIVWHERHAYDTVLVHMNQEYVLLCGILWRLLGKRVGLWYAHGHVPLSLRLALPLVHVVLTSTPQGFRLETPKKHVLGQGIDTTFYAPGAPADTADLRLISVGRLSPVKDYESMIEAVVRLREEKVLSALRIVGGAGRADQEQYRDALEQLAAVRAPGAVSFAGPRDPAGVRDELQQADLFLNASRTGSLDKAILEAMACGVPVVTCNESAVALFGPGQGVFAFVPGDATDLATVIARFAALPAPERARLGSAARDAVVRDHDLTAFARRLIVALG